MIHVSIAELDKLVALVHAVVEEVLEGVSLKQVVTPEDVMVWIHAVRAKIEVNSATTGVR